jgi:hypothetical protein
MTIVEICEQRQRDTLAELYRLADEAARRYWAMTPEEQQKADFEALKALVPERPEAHSVIQNAQRYRPWTFCARVGDESTRIAPPARIVVEGSNEQAHWVAEALSNHFAGCEYFYVVEGDE